MMIERQLKSAIKSHLSMNKIIVIYGARQVGKTTLAMELFEGQKFLYLNGDEFEVQQMFGEITKMNIENIVKNDNYIIIDEAQKIRDIGVILKIIHDYFPDKKVIATGSSSFDLANKVNEPLTGRKFEYTLFPFSLEELRKKYNYLEMYSGIKQFMVTGLYPEMIMSQNDKVLSELTNSYLYKDILSFDKIQKSDALMKLVSSLALQIGSEVSYHELGQQCGLHPNTVEQYIQILEKSFIIFRLQPYTFNQRKGISKLKKIYFWDLGIRNRLIGNLNHLEIRNDVGSLRENFAIVEILKQREYNQEIGNYYFRRDGKSEVDLLVSSGGELHGYEFKYGKSRGKNLKYINEKIKLDSYTIINRENILNYV